MAPLPMVIAHPVVSDNRHDTALSGIGSGCRSMGVGKNIAG